MKYFATLVLVGMLAFTGLVIDKHYSKEIPVRTPDPIMRESY